MRYFTSDTHYGHANIIGYCRRPHVEVEAMNGDLVARAAEVLTSGDELWHLGDVALGRLADTLPHLRAAANGASITLVAGNHDRCHPSNGARSDRFVDLYEEACGLATLIRTNTRLTLPGGTEVQLSHFPYADDVAALDRDAQRRTHLDPWRPVDDGSWLLCGHVHEAWRQRGRMINVGVDAWRGRPVDEHTLCELIAAGPQDLPAVPWR